MEFSAKCLSYLTIGLLTGCAYYGDIHKNSTKIDENNLNTPTVILPKPSNQHATTGWWHQFHDPQLNAIMAMAFTDSPALKIAQARVRQSQHLAEAAGATLWPSIDLNTSVQRQRYSEYGLIPPPFNGETLNFANVGLNFNYEFDFWGKNREALKAQLGTTFALAANKMQAILVIASSITHTYLQLENAVSQINIAQAQLKLNQQKLGIIQTQFAHGIQSQIPVKSIQIAIANAAQNLDKYKANALLAQHQLAVLVGKNPENTVIDTTHFKYHPHPIAIPKNLPANLLANRPDIIAAKWTVEADAHRVNAVKARFFPNINLNLLFSYQSIYLNKLLTPAAQDYAATGAIDLPLFDAGKRRADLKAMYAKYDVSVNQYNATILNALKEVTDQITTLHTTTLQLDAQNAALNAAKQNEHLHELLYHRGIVDYVSLIDFKLAVLAQQSYQLTLQTAQLQTTAALITALGGIDDRR